MNQAEKIARAEQAGRDAYNRDVKNVPVYDSMMCGRDGLLSEAKAGEEMSMLKAWRLGWMDENLRAPVPGWTDEENAAMQRATGRL